MKINDLNIIAQRLGAFGKEHLGIDHRGHTVPTTSSLGGRIASWIRSRHSDTAAQANRDVMTGIINTIRQTIWATASRPSPGRAWKAGWLPVVP